MIEAYVVPEISSIQNGHVELARNEYPHLKDLWFSDVCKAQEEIEIDILVGAHYLWNSRKSAPSEESPMSQLRCRRSWVGCSRGP